MVLGVVLFLLFKSKPVEVTKIDDSKPVMTIIGTSVEGRNIEAYTFGKGEKHLFFVGGIHGGYEWNSVMLAYKFLDYLTLNPEIIFSNLTVTVIPSANPDGLYQVTKKDGRFAVSDVINNLPNGTGRFNVHGVDLNRNFDCNWQATSTWKGNTVSAGTKPFSEPEALALKNFILKDKPLATVFWHSQSNAVYASQCERGILSETVNIMDTYAKASGYPAIKTFDSYAVTGAVEDWLASINIPAITVELKTHETIEWEQNLAGIKALFDYYGQK